MADTIEMVHTHHVVNAVVIYRERGVIRAIQYLQGHGVSFEVALAVLDAADTCSDQLRNNQPVP